MGHPVQQPQHSYLCWIPTRLKGGRTRGIVWHSLCPPPALSLWAKGLHANTFSNLKLFSVESVLSDIGSICSEVVCFPFCATWVATLQRENCLTLSPSTLKKAESQKMSSVGQAESWMNIWTRRNLFLAIVKNCLPTVGVWLCEDVSWCVGWTRRKGLSCTECLQLAPLWDLIFRPCRKETRNGLHLLPGWLPEVLGWPFPMRVKCTVDQLYWCMWGDVSPLLSHPRS